jgi:sec-independent protein translocase protein TatA
MSAIVPSLALLGFGIWEMVLVFLVIMVLFGTKKLPSLARGLGIGIRNFKGEIKGPPDDSESDRKD